MKNKIAEVMSLSMISIRLVSAKRGIVPGQTPPTAPHPQPPPFPTCTPCPIPEAVSMKDFAPVTRRCYIAQLHLRKGDDPGSPDLITWALLKQRVFSGWWWTGSQRHLKCERDLILRKFFAVMEVTVGRRPESTTWWAVAVKVGDSRLQ